MTDTPAAAPAAAAPAAPAAGANWFDGADSEIVGHIQNRGLDKLDAKGAALEAVKAHREAEKLLGAPKDQLLRMPKDAADAEGWQRFNERVGVPKEAKEYDFSTVKFANGDALDDGFVQSLAPALQAAHVSKADAPAIVKAIASYLEKAETDEASSAEQALNAERDALKINWGSRVEANLIVAKNAAAALNVPPEAVSALEKVIGYAKVMEMFRNIGERIGEDRFVTTGVPGQGVMSADQANATLAERMNDATWASKLAAGDAQTLKEFDNLTRMKAAAGR